MALESGDIITTMNHEQLLARGLAALDFDISSGIVERLSRYLDELERWNPHYGLVHAEGEELVIKHVLDSLAPWHVLAEVLSDIENSAVQGEKVRIVDIGTGAGFPGIPLSMVFSDHSFVLMERLEKECAFWKVSQHCWGSIMSRSVKVRWKMSMSLCSASCFVH